jgi:hypothetical protein
MGRADAFSSERLTHGSRMKTPQNKKSGGASRASFRKGHLLMGLSAILIATALSLTMLVAVADLP